MHVPDPPHVHLRNRLLACVGVCDETRRHPVSSTSLRSLPAQLRSYGRDLDMNPDAIGELRDSSASADDVAVLRTRMQQDGYLYLPGYLDREEVLSARRDITRRLADEGHLDPRFPHDEAVVAEDADIDFKKRADLALASQPLQRLLYSRTGRIMQFFAGFLGGDVHHFEYTWLRTVPPGTGTYPHGDAVFMNRGTKNLFTAWTPLGDISYEMGGLIMLEGSHQHRSVKQDYGRRDVSEYCSNHADAEDYASGRKTWKGEVSDDAAELRAQLGGRWLTDEFRAGDLLVFGIYMLHASLDNHTSAFRLSSDSRYQLASDSIDPRWIGEDPIAYGPSLRKGMVC